MKRYHLPNYPLALDGDGVRHVYKNDHDYPKLDILIRESIQNSSDAILPSSEYLDYYLNYGKFYTEKFVELVGDPNNRISSTFSEQSDYIEIRDLNTKGLGGPVYPEDTAERGDFVKLVFAIGDRHSKNGNGGSWGYGKTSYYTLGRGFVIYYTQTEYQGRLESRLIITLIENTQHREEMLFPGARVGVTYWGSDLCKNVWVTPLIDKSEIETVLSVFGVKPFEKNQTGTSIIIPFVNMVDIFNESIHCIEGPTIEKSYSDKYMDSLIKLTIQRWYFPRLMNTSQPQFLRASINGKLLERKEILPIFRDFQEMYNETFTTTDYIYSEQSWVNNKSTPMAAFVSRELHFSDYTFPHNYTLYQLLESTIGLGKTERINTAIGFRCRSLGMINHYDFDNSFVKNVEDSDPDTFLVVALRPLPEVQLYNPDDPTSPITNLEEYLRKTEDPSHTEWKDVALSEIDPKASKNSRQIIQSICMSLGHKFAKKESRQEKNIRLNVGISKTIGSLLFSMSGNGDTKSKKKILGRKKKKKEKKPKQQDLVDIISFKRYPIGEKVVLEFKLAFEGKTTDCTLSLLPVLDNGESTTIASWEETCGIPYPATIESFNILEIDGEKAPGIIEMGDSNSYIVDGVEFKLRKNNGKTIALSLRKSGPERLFLIKLTFDQSSCDFKTTLVLEEGGFEE